MGTSTSTSSAVSFSKKEHEYNSRVLGLFTIDYTPLYVETLIVVSDGRWDVAGVHGIFSSNVDVQHIRIRFSKEDTTANILSLLGALQGLAMYRLVIEGLVLTDDRILKLGELLGAGVINEVFFEV